MEEVLPSLPSLELLRVEETYGSVLYEAAKHAEFQRILKATETTLSFVRSTCYVGAPLEDCQLPRGGSCPMLWGESYQLYTNGEEQLPQQPMKQLDYNYIESSDGEEIEYSISMRAQTAEFEDHRGQPSYMVFLGPINGPLPPLFSYAIYFTHNGHGARDC
ncbi:hypothetical protein BJX63DRAFT_432608 [Aspergillus granulosus]|uniref:Uncharacterized protein n=1 Tax=Aspergillus granulosus TaxID=176169 RepID=A0ABR4HAM9_9EURO